MAFYEFDQNNSGGSFHIDDTKGIGPRVWVEADSIEDANNKALEIGIYFNGCNTGMDCDCCGDRWYPQEDWRFDDGEEGHYKVQVTLYDFNWHDTVYIHTKDGTINRLRVN